MTKSGEPLSQKSTAEATSMVMEEWSYQGPLPPSSELRAIDNVVPGGAAKLVALIELETIHRHKLETRQQTFPLIDSLFGRFVALAFAGGGFYTMILLSNSGGQVPASILGGGMIIARMNVLMDRSNRAGKSEAPPPRSKRK